MKDGYNAGSESKAKKVIWYVNAANYYYSVRAGLKNAELDVAEYGNNGSNLARIAKSEKENRERELPSALNALKAAERHLNE